MRAAIVLLLTFVLAAWLTDSALRTPAPRAADAPARQFSAGRARVDLDWLAARPHPVGSPELHQVREQLVARLRGLGLEVSTQPALAISSSRRGSVADTVAAHIENVIAVLPGQDRAAPALLLMAHVDTVAHSAGAADDGIGVVALIEIARALKAGPPPQCDVVLLITDGEEVALLGARAFFAEHPLAERVGALINLEARGSSGRVSMFETGPDNAAMIALYARLADRPSASSLTRYAYEQMPNSTDFSVALEKKLPGLNFAILGDQFDYHAASATAANLDLGSLQQMGDQALAISHQLAHSTALPSANANAVYADLFGRWLIHYPAWIGWILLAISGGLLWLSARRLRCRASDLLRETGVVLYVLIVAALALRLGYRLLGGTVTARLSEARTLLAGFDHFMLGAAAVVTAVAVLACIAQLRGVGRYTLAVLAVAIAAGCSINGIDPPALGAGAIAAVIALAAFAPRRAVPGVGIGIAAVVWLLGLIAQALAPELTPILLWPSVLGALALALLGRGGSTPAIMLLAVLGLAFVAQFGQQCLVALGFGLPEVAAGAGLIGLIALHPLLVATLHPVALGERRGRRALTQATPAFFGWLIGLVGIGCWLLIALRPAGDARHPALSQVIHVSDVSTPEQPRDYRISMLDPLDDWSRQVLATGGSAITRGELPAAFLSGFWRADSAPAAAQPMTLAFATDATSQRRTLTITPPADSRELRLQLRSSVAISGVQLNGKAIELLNTPNDWSRLRLFPGDQPIELSWTADSGSLDIQHAAISDNWPGDAVPLPERPRDVMPWGMSDTHIVTATTTLAW